MSTILNDVGGTLSALMTIEPISISKDRYLSISHGMGVAGRGTEQVDLSLIVRLHHERLAEKVIEDGVVHEDDLWDASN